MNPARHLVLVGPMGAGKTSIGRCLARHFGMPFVDCDQEIEKHTGAAIPTIEHLEQGKVLSNCVDIEQAKASLMEAVEIADLLVLGRDNAVMNMTRRGV